MWGAAAESLGILIATASGDGTVRLWGQRPMVPESESQGMTSGYDGSNAVGVPSSTTLEFSLLDTLRGHSNAVVAVAFSADGHRAASGAWDRTCRLWGWV